MGHEVIPVILAEPSLAWFLRDKINRCWRKSWLHCL